MPRLKELRIAQNITLRAMAEIDPPLSKAIVLADFFNVSLDYLVGRSDDPTRL